MTIEEIFNDVFDTTKNKLRFEIGTSSSNADMTIEEMLNSIHNPTSHSLIINI